MKKIKLLAIAIVFGISSLHATEIVTDIPVKLIRTQIAELFNYPDFEMTKDVNVYILFTFDSEENVKVLRIESYDKNIKKYIYKQMDRKKIEYPGEIGKTYELHLQFNQQE